MNKAQIEAFSGVVAEKDVEIRRLRSELEQAQAEIAALGEALEDACPDAPMNQDEQGGCVWCGGSGKGLYAGASPADHHASCAWLKGRAALASPSPVAEAMVRVCETAEAYDSAYREAEDGLGNMRPVTETLVEMESALADPKRAQSGEAAK